MTFAVAVGHRDGGAQALSHVAASQSVYNGADMLRAQEIAKDIRMRKSQENEDKEDVLSLRLYGDADLVYIKFKE